MIDQKYINMILDQVPIETVVKKYTNLKRVGRDLVGLCPLPGHTERTPSFHVSPDKGYFHCFGCSHGGNVITFYMLVEGVEFPIAVKLLLKEYLSITLDESKIQANPEEEAKEKLRQSMLIYNEKLQEFFTAQLQEKTTDALTHKSYAIGRWGANFCKEIGVGYAPKGFQTVANWAEKTGLDFDILKQMGVLHYNDQYHSWNCIFIDRITIPIRDRSGKIIGFTARTLDPNNPAKYKNSSNSIVYDKGKSVFGINFAATQARKEEKMFLVEGGPDVMKLQSLDINNVVASLGGAWTDEQFAELKKLHVSLCFIPDSDVPKPGEKLGQGFKNVMRSGTRAMQLGFNVSVREIPCNKSKKRDPDEYIKSRAIFDKLDEEEFVFWYARKTFKTDMLTEERQKFIETLCNLIVCIQDEDLQEEYFAQLVGKYGHRTAWQNGMKSVKKRKVEAENKAKNKEANGIDMLREFGFIEKGNCYYGTTKDGKEVRWSNFKLKPLFHIKDEVHPVRLFMIDNNDFKCKPEMIELDMDTLTSSKNLRKKLLGIGNYTWLADDNALIKLQTFMAKETETAVEIKQLGWNRLGFFSFCNGAWEDGKWYDIDKMGIVRLKAGTFYLPALSELYKDSDELFVNEKKFIRKKYSAFTLNEYFTKIVDVFGDNAKVGLLFYIASLFRDIIKPKIQFFPILNIFGPKGSGKTQLAKTLTQFFIDNPEPPNLESGTFAALSDSVASVSNALVHLDEYKNSIPPIRIEWLKDLWGGIGRVKMNMDKDKKREQARVDCGIIVTGQEMPTSDIALFSRLIFLTYDKQHHNAEERRNYDELMKMREMGGTNITLQLLNHRDSFETSWNNAWLKAGLDLERALHGVEIMDRIEHNWQVPLAAYLAIEQTVKLPFTYEDLLNICVEGVKRQNDLCENTDEVAKFWNIIDSAHQKGMFKEGQDYMVKYKDKLYTNTQKTPWLFEASVPVLMIRQNSMLATYKQLGNQMAEHLLPSESLLHYLVNTPEYIGKTSNPERFKRFNNNGQIIQQPIVDAGGNVKGYKTIWDKDRPLCFKYNQISLKYGIILDSDIGEPEQNAPGNDPEPTLFDEESQNDEPF